MTHDLEDLLEIIKQLEIRILQLEKNLDTGVTVIASDGWYFDY